MDIPKISRLEVDATRNEHFTFEADDDYVTDCSDSMNVSNTRPSLMGTLTMLELEACLGFHFENGLSRTKSARRIPVIAKLLDGIREIASHHLEEPRSRLKRQPKAVKHATDELFNDLGPQIWPPGQEPCPPWLFDHERDRNGIATQLRPYLPSRLHFDCEDQQTRLRRLFRMMVLKKCLRYTDNHRGQFSVGSTPQNIQSVTRKRQAVSNMSAGGSSSPTPHDEAYYSIGPSCPGNTFAEFMKASVITIWIGDGDSSPCDHFNLAGLFTCTSLFDQLGSRLKDEFNGASISHILVRKFGGWEIEELPSIVPVRRGDQLGGWEDLTQLMCEKSAPKGMRLMGFIKLSESI